MLCKGQRKLVSSEENTEATALCLKSYGLRKPLQMTDSASSLLGPGGRQAARPAYPSLVALHHTFVNAEDACVLTPTIEADLQEEENTVNFSAPFQPHARHL